MWRLAYQGHNKKMNCAWGLLALFGLGLAMAGASVPRPAEPSDKAVLWVNDQPITITQLAYVEERLTEGRAVRLTEVERRSMIELLIDEELLLQRAESLGVVENDPGVRKAIAHAAISEVVEEFLARPVDQEMLEQFYRDHSAVFERPARLAISVLRFDSLLAAERAHANIESGGMWADIVAGQEAETIRNLPSSPLPVHVLRRYLGPGLASVALTLKSGEISHPVESGGRAHLLKANTVLAATVPEFSEIAPVVREEYLSRGREQALADKLEKLWQAANIQFSPRVAGDLAVSEKDYPELVRVAETDKPRGEYQ